MSWQEVPRTAIMLFRRMLIFWSLDIFHVKDSTVSPFGPLSAFCFASQAQFEGVNETLLYSVEPSSFDIMALRIDSYRYTEEKEKDVRIHEGKQEMGVMCR